LADSKAVSEDERRRFLKVLVAAGGAAFTGALAVRAVVFVSAPLAGDRSTGARWVKTVRLDSLPEGEPKKVSIVADQRDAWTLTRNVELGAAWLIRKGDKVVALSTSCPHLGCAVGTAPDGKSFGCPCHTSSFDPQGKRTGGPSPRDMDPLETRIEDGIVLVDFRRYRISIADRVEVG